MCGLKSWALSWLSGTTAKVVKSLVGFPATAESFFTHFNFSLKPVVRVFTPTLAHVHMYTHTYYIRMYVNKQLYKSTQFSYSAWSSIFT